MKINILIVEDNPAMRVVIRQTLLESGIEIGKIFEASNGREGIDLLDTESVNLMLVDIYMPVMDGMEMLDYTSEHPDLKEIPAIVISTENSEERIDTIVRKGLGFIHKPLTQSLLKDRILDLMKKRRDSDVLV